MPDLPEEALQAPCPCICHVETRPILHNRACCPAWNGRLDGAAGDSLPHIEARVRREVAEQIREIVEDDGPVPLPNWRAFKARHPRLVTGDSIVAVLLAVADEIEGDARVEEA